MVTACDNAGLCSDEAQAFNIDTTTPSLTLNFLGSLGQNNWYTTVAQVTASVSDAGSGLESVQQSLDGGATWSSVLGPLSFAAEGIHSYQILVCDKAGLCADTSSQQIKIDTIPPTLNLPSSWKLGDIAKYSAEDPSTGSGQVPGSGLAYSNIRVEGRNYTEGLSGTSATDELYWNGKDSKGRTVPAGEYDMVVKVFDQAGNETRGHTTVEVNLFSSFFVSDRPDNPIVEAAPTLIAPILSPSFGGVSTGSTTAPSTITTTSGNTTHSAPLVKDSASVRFGVDSSTTPITNQQTGNILWGAAAAALVGATLADWQKKREEEARRLAELEAKKAASAGRPDIKAMREAEKAHDAAVRARWAAQAQASSMSTTNAAMERKMARLDEAEDARWRASQAVIAQRGLEKDKIAYDQRMSEHDTSPIPAPKNDAGWLSNLWNAGTTALGSVLSPAKNTGGGKLAMPALDEKDDPWWKKLWNWLIGGNPQQSNSSPNAIQTAAFQTAWAQITQTFQVQTQTAQPTATITPSSTIVLTPTPVLNRMVIMSDGLNLRIDPNPWATLAFNGSIPRGGTVYVDPNIRPVINNGFCWVRTSYTDPTINAGAIASSPQFFDPLTNFIRITDQGTPITYSNAIPGWEGRHIGNDFAPLPNTDPNPPIITSANGIVTNSGVQKKDGTVSGYGNYVILEYPSASLPRSIQLLPSYIDGKSLYAIYGHLLNDMSATVKMGDQIPQGATIGNIGASGNTGGYTHLHLELRLGDANQSLNAANGDWYNASKLPPIDPALIFTPNDTWTGWAAQSQWDSQLNCGAGDPFLGNP